VRAPADIPDVRRVARTAAARRIAALEGVEEPSWAQLQVILLRIATCEVMRSNSQYGDWCDRTSHGTAASGRFSVSSRPNTSRANGRRIRPPVGVYVAGVRLSRPENWYSGNATPAQNVTVPHRRRAEAQTARRWRRPLSGPPASVRPRRPPSPSLRDGTARPATSRDSTRPVAFASTVGVASAKSS